MNIQMLLTEQPNRVDASMARCRLWPLESIKSRMRALTSADIVIYVSYVSSAISTKMIFGKWSMVFFINVTCTAPCSRVGIRIVVRQLPGGAPLQIKTQTTISFPQAVPLYIP